jgi:Fe-S-cluster containining protein
LGCCRYNSNSSIWSPNLLEQEKRELGLEKIELIPINESYICRFLNLENNQCRIYKKRPWECRLYPFLLNYRGQKLYIGVDLGCPFIKDKINSEKFKRYLNYLNRYLLKPSVSSTLNRNRKLFPSYPAEQVVNLAELKI